MRFCHDFIWEIQYEEVLGAGQLTLPYALSLAGLPLGLAILGALGLLATHSLAVLSERPDGTIPRYALLKRCSKTSLKLFCGSTRNIEPGPQLLAHGPLYSAGNIFSRTLKN